MTEFGPINQVTIKIFSSLVS
uniref:Uncharacterized protein n=1 Tax=Anguilla anguilla TaxID=7936 RepID=A0A0E9VAU8_ANGAN